MHFRGNGGLFFVPSLSFVHYVRQHLHQNLPVEDIQIEVIPQPPFEQHRFGEHGHVFKTV